MNNNIFRRTILIIILFAYSSNYSISKKTFRNYYNRNFYYCLTNEVIPVAEDLIDRKLVNINGVIYNSLIIRPLEYTLKKKNNAMTEFLIKKGAEINYHNKDGLTPLMSNNTNYIYMALIKYGADVNAKNESGRKTVLEYSIKKKMTYKSIYLIQNGAFITERCMSLALKNGNPHLIKMIYDVLNNRKVESKIDPLVDNILKDESIKSKISEYYLNDIKIEYEKYKNRKITKKVKPLFRAILDNDIEGFKTIVNKYSKRKLKKSKKELYYIISYDRVEMFDYLYKIGIDIKQEYDDTKLYKYIPINGSSKILKFAIENNLFSVDELRNLLFLSLDYNEYSLAKFITDSNIFKKKISVRGNTKFLRDVVEKDDVEKLNFVLKNFDFGIANIEYPILVNTSQPHYSCPNIVKYLLKNKKIEFKYFDEYNHPLSSAASYGYYDIVKLYIDYGVDVNSFQSSSSPLCDAAKNGHYDICKLLIKNGADVNYLSDLKNSWISTPLMSAAEGYHYDIAKLLIDNGAGVKFTDNTGRTALHCACRSGNYKIVELLLKKGADINKQDNDGNTPLISAIYMGNLEAAKVLIENGADISIKNNDGYDARTLAKKREFKEVLWLLKK